MASSVPIPILPFERMRSLSLPSVVIFTCPSEPVSTVSTSVLPSLILSESIPVNALPSPE